MCQIRPLLPPGKANLIPVEILSEIFLLALEDLWYSENRMHLMLVCWHWHAIVLSTPGIHSELTIRRATQKEVVQQFIQSTKSHLNVRVDMNDEEDGSVFNAENFHACFMAAAQATSRWSSFHLISPPPHGEYNHVQILGPLMHLETITVCHGFGKFFELDILWDDWHARHEESCMRGVRAGSGWIGSGLRCWQRPHSTFTKGMTSRGIGKEIWPVLKLILKLRT